jgi:ubiquinone/menaquinone biosynthesis C-methylase UbiE
MATGKDTIWERFLSPIVRSMIDEEELRRFSNSVDWEREGDRFRNPQLTYPDYYRKSNFHGIESGYLNPSAAVSYDPVTQYVLPPNETWVREDAIKLLRSQPRRILDLGCGTGSTTVLLKQTFPNADVIGIDLSPYMLFMAERKAQQQGLNIQWLHGNAESTPFPDASFDVVTASLLFHETPQPISKAILRECFRLLQAGGEVLVLDGNQKSLRQTEWLMEIFEEPYIRSYAEGSVEASMGAAGFEAVQTEEIWWVHQATRGVKPMEVSDTPRSAAETFETPDIEGIPAPAFGSSA